MDAAHTTFHDGRLTASVEGELDMATAPALSAVVDRSLAEHRPSRLVFDLHRLTFVDSSGISALVHYARELPDAGCDVVLTRVPARTLRLFELTRLLPLLRVEPAD